MTAASISFSVFTKPWKTPLAQLGPMVAELGFDGIELPVRPGYQVEPKHVARDLEGAVCELARQNVRITSVAAEPTETLIAACAEAGIPLIRTMAPIDGDGYAASVARLQRRYAKLLPVLERHRVQLGIQNHYGRYVCNASGLAQLLAPFDTQAIGAVWDAGHTALCGEEPELALEMVWPKLRLVNLKNAFWRRVSGPEAEDVVWAPYWTSGRQGLASWPRVAAELRRRAYSGAICLTAEYSDELAVKRLIVDDLAYVRTLFG